MKTNRKIGEKITVKSIANAPNVVTAWEVQYTSIDEAIITISDGRNRIYARFAYSELKKLTRHKGEATGISLDGTEKIVIVWSHFYSNLAVIWARRSDWSAINPSLDATFDKKQFLDLLKKPQE
jgi:hypothetical protein